MREIKFRGLRKDGKGWAYGMPTHDLKYVFGGGQYDSPDSYEVIPGTVGQYIATNGRQDFYVGDIVVNPKGREHTVVIWDNIPCLKYTNKGKVYFQPMTQGFLNNKKLIGNIHENKDLI